MASRQSLPFSNSIGISISPAAIEHFHDENDFGIPNTPPMHSLLDSAMPAKKVMASKPIEAQAGIFTKNCSGKLV